MNQRFRVLQELGEQFERASEAADVDQSRSLGGTRLLAIGLGLRRGSTRVWAVIGAAGVALIAGIATAVVLLSSSAPVAYAGWTPTPTTPTSAALPAGTPVCNPPPSRTPGSQPSSGKLVLTDVRGRYTAVMYVFGDFVRVCMSDGNSGAGSEGDGLVLRFYAAPGPDELGLPSGGSGALNGFSVANTNQPLPEPFQRILQAIQNPTLRARHAEVFRQLLADGVEANVYGRAGRDVAAVTFVFGDGITVDATVQNGWYFAWWPGVDQPTSVQVITQSGQHIDSQMPGRSCMRGSSGCGVFAGLQAHPELCQHGARLPVCQNLPAAGAPAKTTATTSTTTTATTTTPTTTASTTNTQSPTTP